MTTSTTTAERQRLSDLAAPAEAAPLATRRPEVLPPDSQETAVGPRLVASTLAVPHVSGRSPQMGQLAAAMAAAQGEILLAITNQEGKSKGKNSGVEFTFPYADLGAIIDVCSGPLSKHRIARFQPAKTIGSTNRVSVTTLLVHESGEWIAETIELPIEQGVLTAAQAIGAAMTYARRYGLSSLLGIGVADGEDVDAGHHEDPVRPGKGPVQMPQRESGRQDAARPAPATSHAGTPAPPPAPGPQTSASEGFTVTAIEKRPRQNKPGFFWPVQFSNGVIASTFSPAMGAALEKAFKDGTRYADVLTTRNGKFIYIDELVPMPTEPSW